jgi:hypothetical protein
VPVKVRRSLRALNPDGKATLHVFIEADVPPPPGDGEPIPAAS